MGSTNVNISLPQHEILSNYKSPASTLITPSASSYASEDDQEKFTDNNNQVQYELLDQGNFCNALDQKTSDIDRVDSIWDECLSKLDADSNQIHQTTTASTNISDDFLSYEELMDILPFPEDYGESTRSPIHEYVSRSFRWFRYAFITHRTAREAEVNLRRSINVHLLGPACHIGYANKRTIRDSSQQSLNKKEILVHQIPPNVSENDLRQLFGNCHVEKYYSAAIISHEATMTKTKDVASISSG
ncbi:unnamed protein product [Adineta steineri]|uniref:Uncharacterized protein n=1 Tax=Adineta steineri TaxID=433720 RepID=A0A814SN74_9BILA|nr:unnamed protein product [Adineta steineri]